MRHELKDIPIPQKAEKTKHKLLTSLWSPVLANWLVVWALIGHTLSLCTNISSASEGWQVIDPGGAGFVTSVEVDPRDDNIVYASTNVSGIKISKDGGNSWQMLTPPREEYAKYGRQVQQVQERLAIHPKRPGMLLYSIKTKRFPAAIYAYTESEKRFQVVYRPEHDVGNFNPFVFDPFDDTGDTAYTAVGDIHFVDGSHYADRFVGTRSTKGFAEAPCTLVLQLRYDPREKKWETVTLYESENSLHIYSIAIRKSSQQAAKEFFFTTDRGLYRAHLDEVKSKLIDFGPWQPSTVIPSPEDFTGGKIVYDPRNKHFYLTVLTLNNQRKGKSPQGGGLFISLDDGKTWLKANQKSKVLDPSTYYFDIGLHPENANIVYVAMRYNLKKRRNHGTYLYRSLDGGQTWANVWDDKNGFEWGWMVFGQKGRQENRVKKPRLAVNLVSVGKKKVYATGQSGQIFVRDGEGQKWRQITTRQIRDGGWTSTGFAAIAVPHSIGFHPTKPDEIFIAYGDHAFFRTYEGKEGLFLIGQNRDYNSLYGGHVAINHHNPNLIYFATRGAHRALQQGSVIRGDLSLPPEKRWQFIAGCHRKGIVGCSNQHGLTRGAMTSIFVDYREKSEDIYVTKYIDRPEGLTSSAAGDAPGVYVLKEAERVIREGNWQWQLISTGISYPMSMEPIDDFSKLIVGCGIREYWNRWSAGSIYVLQRKPDGTWEQREIFNGKTKTGKDISVVYDIDFCATNRMIYFATEKGVFKIDLKGQNLSPVWGEGQYEFTSLEINNRSPNIMYISSEFAGLYRSEDYGKTWMDLSNDLETPSIHKLELDSENDRIYVITCNNGIWTKSFNKTK